MIQQRLCSAKNKKPEDTDKIFARLMLQGKVGAALRWIGSNKSSVHGCTPGIIAILKQQHPVSAKPSCNSMIKGPIRNVEEAIYENIDGDLVQQCAKRINGAAGPSGADAEMWQRILSANSSKVKSNYSARQKKLS